MDYSYIPINLSSVYPGGMMISHFFHVELCSLFLNRMSITQIRSQMLHVDFMLIFFNIHIYIHIIMPYPLHKSQHWMIFGAFG